MAHTLTLKNYRCFSDSHPLRFSFERGLTAIIGPNNCGKSSLLKFFHEFRPLWEYLADTSNLINARSGFQWGVSPQEISDPLEVFCDRNERNLSLEFSLDGVPPGTEPHDVINAITLTNERERPSTWQIRTNRGMLDRRQQSYGFKDGYIVDGQGYRTECWVTALDLLKVLRTSIYLGPFRNAINQGAGSHFDLAVGSNFITTWNEWKTGAIKAQNRRIADVTEDIRRIFGFRSLEINAAEKLKTLQVVIDGRPYKLQELGAGIAQFILVFANVAIRNPSYILLDEPELHLHPSLQVDFLTSLASYASHGIIFATHSIGLARSTADRIFSLNRVEENSILKPFEQTISYAEFLGEMSFSAYRELGFNTILLVEGATDVKTVQQWLRLYKKEHEVVVIPLGGGQLIRDNIEHELAEMTRITKRIFVLVDSERANADAILDAPRQKFRQICKNLGLHACFTERRATENYLTDAAVKAEKGTKYQALDPYELLQSSSMPWAKHENWRIARHMTKADLDNTDVGRFLADM